MLHFRQVVQHVGHRYTDVSRDANLTDSPIDGDWTRQHSFGQDFNLRQSTSLREQSISVKFDHLPSNLPIARRAAFD